MELAERNSAVSPPPAEILAPVPRGSNSTFPHWKVVWAAVNICMGGMAVGTVYAFPSPAFPKMNSRPNNPFRLSLEEQSWAVSAVSFGGLAGGLLARFFMDAWGRKLTLLASTLPLTLGWLIILCAEQAWMLPLGRSFTGLAVGLAGVCSPIYVAEISPTAQRGFLLTFYPFLLSFGVIWSYLIGEFFDWTWLVVSYIGFVVLTVGGLSFIPESPRWLLLKGYADGAEQALRWFRGGEAGVKFEMEMIKENIRNSDQETMRPGDMLKGQYLKPLLLTLGLVTVQIWGGISVIDAYTVDIFSAGGHMKNIDPYLATTIIGAVQFVGNFYMFYLMNKAGRRIMLVISGIGMTVSLLAMAAFFKVKEMDPNFAEEYLYWLPIASIVLYFITFDLGWSPIPPAMMGELLPLKIRGLAGGITVAWAWISIFLTTKFYAAEVEAIGEFGVFVIYAGFTVAGVLFALFILPETRNKTLEDIEKSFKK